MIIYSGWWEDEVSKFCKLRSVKKMIWLSNSEKLVSWGLREAAASLRCQWQLEPTFIIESVTRIIIIIFHMRLTIARGTPVIPRYISTAIKSVIEHITRHTRLGKSKILCALLPNTKRKNGRKVHHNRLSSAGSNARYLQCWWWHNPSVQ